MWWFLIFVSLPFISFLGVICYVCFKTNIFKGGLALAALVGLLIMGVFNYTPMFPMALVFGGGLFALCYFITTTCCRW